MTERTPDALLAELRVEIDRIDAAMHGLLMERGRIIDRLIAIKAAQGGGSAFRPGREAAMMRSLAERHEGLLPLDTAEGIWRIIISTFTYVQAPYSVHADSSSGDAATRDTVRFHFGFTVPLVSHAGPGSVIGAVARSQGDLGVVRIDSGPASGAWWMALTDDGAPRIIARLPFVERPDHPAGMPVFVLSKPLAEAAARDVVIRAIVVERWRDGIGTALAGLSGEILGQAAEGMGLSLLIATPGEVDEATVRDALRQAGVGDVRMSEVGSHARRFEVGARRPRALAAE
jgi:chorismate mutase